MKTSTEVAKQSAKEDQPSRNDERQHDIQMKDHSKLKQRRSTNQNFELTDFRLDSAKTVIQIVHLCSYDTSGCSVLKSFTGRGGLQIKF